METQLVMNENPTIHWLISALASIIIVLTRLSDILRTELILSFQTIISLVFLSQASAYFVKTKTNLHNWKKKEQTLLKKQQCCIWSGQVCGMSHPLPRNKKSKNKTAKPLDTKIVFFELKVHSFIYLACVFSRPLTWSCRRRWEGWRWGRWTPGWSRRGSTPWRGREMVETTWD